MAIPESNCVKAQNKAGGKGEITIEHLLSAKELGQSCDMYAKVTIGPGCSIGLHEHHGNAESYHILQGEALYNDNGRELHLGTGTTTFCPDGEKHAIANCATSGDLVFMALIVHTASA
jgi:mannose-6-phosphate isomerase-like protein (cupin superfamily)